MKKLLLIFLLSVLLTSVAFAADNSIKASVVPYGFQISTSSTEEVDPVNSTYGIGANVSYSRKLAKGLFAQAGLFWDTFLLPDGKEAFTHILASAEIGYEYNLSDLWSLDAHAGIGTDTLIYMETVSETFTILTGLDAIYALNENLNLFAGCEGTFGFSSKDDTNYVNYRILPKIGVSFEF
ncbi:MAG: hypothetical protein K6F82_02800 [Sphaerochaetaceae bacterium]|nr:hypothetical protein [Sphaerochaetaceae bacterium]